jgi:hypothetical protein
MKRNIFLLLSVAGIILPMSQFIPASISGEFTVGGMLAEMTASRTITGVTFDFLVVVITALTFGIAESVRLKIRWAWVCLVGTFLIGASFGFPFFLFLREGALAKRQSRAEP